MILNYTKLLILVTFFNFTCYTYSENKAYYFSTSVSRSVFGNNSFGDKVKLENPSYYLAFGLGKEINDHSFSINYYYKPYQKIKILDRNLYSNAIQHWSSKSNAMLLNYQYIIMNQSKYNAFLLGGLGISKNTSGKLRSITDSSQTSTPGASNFAFAWQLGVGLNFISSPSSLMFLEYRHIDYGSHKTKTYTNIYIPPHKNIEIPSNVRKRLIKDHIISLGFKYRFN